MSDEYSSDAVDRVEIMRLLNQVVNDNYTEPNLRNAQTDEERQLLETINRVYHEKRKVLNEFDANLRRSERRLRDIVESTPVGLCITNREQKYEYVNPTYCRLYGYQADELLGESFLKVVPEQYREHLSHLHDEFMGRRYELRGEWKVRRKDGAELDIIAEAAYIVDVDGRPKKVTFIVDVTDQKNAERQLRDTVEQLNTQIEERRRIEKVKNQVERIIRHDLRNPLNGVIVTAQLLERTQLDNEQKELVGIILQSGNKLNDMLNTSLDIVQMEEGRFILRAEELSLNEIVDSAVAEVKGIGEAMGVPVEVSGKPGDDTVEGERLHLENLFSNLVRNAVEASSAGDVVTVVVRSDNTQSESDGEQPDTGHGRPGSGDDRGDSGHGRPGSGDVRGDSGHGRPGSGDVRADTGDVRPGGPGYLVEIHNSQAVPEEVRDRFFDQYVTSGKPDGSGIGTYVAKLIAGVHGGTIRFTTSEEDGTTLYVRLPRTAPVQEPVHR